MPSPLPVHTGSRRLPTPASDHRPSPGPLKLVLAEVGLP